jgi:hypothetical protein
MARTARRRAHKDDYAYASVPRVRPVTMRALTDDVVIGGRVSHRDHGRREQRGRGLCVFAGTRRWPADHELDDDGGSMQETQTFGATLFSECAVRGADQRSEFVELALTQTPLPWSSPPVEAISHRDHASSLPAKDKDVRERGGT